MNKLAIASDMLNAIRGLELTPLEVKSLTVMWISQYPYLLKDFGWEIEAHANLQSIVADIERLKAATENAQNNENLVVSQVPEEAKPETVIEAPAEESGLAKETSETQSSDVSNAQSEEKADAPATDSKPAPDTPEIEEPLAPAPRKGYSKNGKRLGRPARKKAEPEEKADAPVADLDKAPDAPKAEGPLATAPPKGFSKNGKKLGRPARKKAPEEATSAEPTQTEPEAPDETPATMVNPKEISPPIVSPAVSADEIINKLKYGKEYEYELLYLVDNLHVRSRFKLQEEAGVKPIGVIIPYKKQKVPYEMVVYFEDEHAVIPLSLAEKYAKSKLVPYKKVPWRVKNPTDDVCIRPALNTINEIFKKMGGDEIKGDYVDGRGQYYGVTIKTNLKIRYVCDIPLQDAQ